MICSLSIFGKIIFVVTVNYDVISIQATRSLEKCGRTVFEIVSPTDDFETTKNGVTLVARLLQKFPCLLVVFMVFVFYLILTVTLCFHSGLANLLRTIMSEKIEKQQILVLNHVVFSEKTENSTFRFKGCRCFFMKCLIDGNMFQ